MLWKSLCGIAPFVVLANCTGSSSDTGRQADDGLEQAEQALQYYPYDSAATWPVQFGTSARDVLAGMGVPSTFNSWVYATGTTQGLLGTPPSSSLGSGDFFTAEFSPNGGLYSLDTLGSVSAEQARSVALSSSATFVYTGLTYGDLYGPNAGMADIYIIARFAFWNSTMWAYQLGTSGNDQGADLAISGSSVFLAASTEGALDGNIAAGSVDMALIKFDLQTGAKAWSRQLGTSGLDYANSVAADSSGNAYLAGETDLALDGNVSAGQSDAVLVKYDGNGQKLWTRQFGSSGYDTASSVAVDSSGNAYVVGMIAGSIDGIPFAGSSDAFLVKYDSAGVKQWTRLLGAASMETGDDVCVDSSGNVYVVGFTNSALDGQSNAGETDAYIAKFDASGQKLWTRLYGTAAADSAKSVIVQGSYIIMGGSTRGALPGKTNAGSDDVMLVRYDQNGNLAP